MWQFLYQCTWRWSQTDTCSAFVRHWVEYITDCSFRGIFQPKCSKYFRGFSVNSTYHNHCIIICVITVAILTSTICEATCRIIFTILTIYCLCIFPLTSSAVLFMYNKRWLTLYLKSIKKWRKYCNSDERSFLRWFRCGGCFFCGCYFWRHADYPSCFATGAVIGSPTVKSTWWQIFLLPGAVQIVHPEASCGVIRINFKIFRSKV